MKFGINQDIEAMAMPGMTLVRRYHAPDQGVPARQPDGIYPGLTSIISIRPDLSKVVDGSLDVPLIEWMRAVPEGSYVTLWHEANLPSHQILPSVWRDANVRLHRLKMTNAIDVFTGYILGTYPHTHAGQDLSPWIIGANADWAGLDGYQLSPEDTPAHIFGSAFKQIIDSPGLPELIITETSTLLEDPANWLDQVIAYGEFGIGGNSLDGVLWYASPTNEFHQVPGKGYLEKACLRAAMAA